MCYLLSKLFFFSHFPGQLCVSLNSPNWTFSSPQSNLLRVSFTTVSIRLPLSLIPLIVSCYAPFWLAKQSLSPTLLLSISSLSRFLFSAPVLSLKRPAYLSVVAIRLLSFISIVWSLTSSIRTQLKNYYASFPILNGNHAEVSLVTLITCRQCNKSRRRSVKSIICGKGKWSNQSFPPLPIQIQPALKLPVQCTLHLYFTILLTVWSHSSCSAPFHTPRWVVNDRHV